MDTDKEWADQLTANVEAILREQAMQQPEVKTVTVAGPWTETQLNAAFERLIATKPTELSRKQVVFLGKAIICLFNRQTFDEQATESTSHQNGHGFNYYDAKPGTYMANYLLSREGNVLSGRFLEKAHQMVKTYHRQIREALLTGELQP